MSANGKERAWFALANSAPTQPKPWLDGTIDHLSFNSVRQIRICPEAWRQRRILNRKERPGEALVLGSAMHRALEFTHRQKITSFVDLPTLEVVEFFHDAAWPSALAENEEEGIRWDREGDTDTPRRDGERMLHAYHHTVSPRIQPIAVEQRIEFEIPEVPVPFIGFVDVVEQTNAIDLKTSKAVNKRPDSNWRLQGAMYSGHLRLPTHFHSVSRAQTPGIATPLESDEMVVNPDPSQWSKITRILQDYAAQVEFYFRRYGPEGPWPMNGIFMDYRGGAACGFCGYRKFCPMWEHERA